jgi:hypothetical protein
MNKDQKGSQLPKGMPTLDEIKAFCALPHIQVKESDAVAVYRWWLKTDFKIKTFRIDNWRNVILHMKRCKKLESQRLPPGLLEHKASKPAILLEARQDRVKHYAQISEEEKVRLGDGFRQWMSQNR